MPLHRFARAAAIGAALCAAAIDAMAIPEEGMSGDSSPLFSLLMQRPGGNSLYLARDDLIRPVLVSDKELEEAYSAMGLPFPDKLFRAPPAQGAGFRRSGSLFTYMLRRTFDLHEISYDVPVALVPDDLGGTSDNAYDVRYGNGPCAGLGRLEADLRGRCVLGPGRYGLIEERMPSAQFMNFGLYHSFSHELPQNGTRADPSALLYRVLPALIGFASSFSEKGFKDPLTSFDSQLYSKGAHRRVLYGDSLADLGEGCSPLSQQLCGFALDGLSVHDFLERQKQDSGIGVSIGRGGRVALSLPRTLLSSDEYVNYGFYTEPELQALRDLGYDIRPREFFGYTVFGGGTAQSPRVVRNPGGFFAYSERTGTYDAKKASEVPLGVGGHIMGDYNVVEQVPTIASVGTAAIGLRIDGSGNSVSVPAGSAIIENGEDACGIAVAYGRGNEVEVDGRISAMGRGGCGVVADFGSNVLSDMQEYRGSYARVRTMDYLNGRLSERAASAMPLPDDLNGPQVRLISVSGRIEAREDAIRIGPRSYVKDIALHDGALLEGAITSSWAPYFDHGEAMIKGDPEGQTLPARLQLPSKPRLFPFSAGDFLHRTVHTTITAGARRGQFGPSAEGDPKSKVEVRGAVKGSSLDFVNAGGHTSITGGIDVHGIRINGGVLSLSGGGSHAQGIDLQDGAVLDMVNGRRDVLRVDGNGYVAGSAVIRLDASPDGRILDEISLPDSSVVLEGTLSVEPGLPFQAVKSFIASPREFMLFMERFSLSARQIFRKQGLKVRYPRRVWYDTGDVGMEVNCSARGCRVGRFLNSRRAQGGAEAPLWRYSASGVGMVLILFFMLMYSIYMKGRAGVRKDAGGKARS
ncbi:MAG: hypothetical protein ACI4NA_00710 [Succinivibrio sp.]